jgi:hypothetical protein
LDEDLRRSFQERWRRVRSASLAAGASTEGIFNVRGQSDFSTAEVWIFPTVDAAYAHWEQLTAAGYSQWFESANNIGTKVIPS